MQRLQDEKLRLAFFLLLVGCGQVESVPVSAPTPTSSVPGTVGSACAFDSECESTVCSADVSSGACGVCLDPQPLGASCTGPMQGCSVSARCSGGVCVSNKKVLGEVCHFGPLTEDLLECDDELYCQHPSAIRMDTGTRVRRIAVGGNCPGVGNPCVRGALCGDDQTCRIPLSSSCRQSEGCGNGFYCDPIAGAPLGEGNCTAGTIPDGGACGIVDGSRINDNCSTGIACASATMGSTCAPLPQLGELCFYHDYQCADGLFCHISLPDEDSAVCEPLRQSGQSCSNDSIALIWCAAGLECRKSICQPACH